MANSKLNDIFPTNTYSHRFNSRRGWNKRGGFAKATKSIKVVVGINMKGGIFFLEKTSTKLQ